MYTLVLLERMIAAVFLLLLIPVASFAKTIYCLFLGQPLLLRVTCIGWQGREFDLFRLNTMKRLYPRLRLLKVIRAMGLDELPNLWNIVKGDMSLVGPRPETIGGYTNHPHFSYRRLRSRPGLTGLWQVSRQRRRGLARSWRLDLFYESRKCAALYLWILAMTARRVLLNCRAFSADDHYGRQIRYLHHLEAGEGGTLKFLEYLAGESRPEVRYAIFERSLSLEGSVFDCRDDATIIRCSRFFPVRILQCLFHSILLFADARPSVVHAHSTLSGFVCRLLGLMFPFKVIYSPHCYAFTYPHRIPGMRLCAWIMERALARRTGLGVHVSESDAAVNLNLDPSAELVVIPPPAEAGICPVVTARCHASRIVIVVGAARIQKGYELLEHIQRRLDASGSGFTLRILGAGKKFGGIYCRPWVRDLSEEYRNAFCLLNVSWSEGCSLAILDAMSYGLPVMASDIPSNRELLEGRGILVKGRDPQRFAAEIIRLSGDPTLYQALHAMSREYASRRHSFEMFASAYDNLYMLMGVPEAANHHARWNIQGRWKGRVNAPPDSFPARAIPAPATLGLTRMEK